MRLSLSESSGLVLFFNYYEWCNTVYALQIKIFIMIARETEDGSMKTATQQVLRACINEGHNVSKLIDLNRQCIL